MDADSQLVREILDGCDKSFQLLTEKYGRLCVHFFRAQFRLDYETAQDLTQEAFLRVFKSADSFQPERAFKPWLLGICRNIGISHVVSAGRKKILPEPREKSTASFEPEIVQKISTEETIRKLPERQAEIVFMRYFWDLNCAEIAQTLSIPVGTVKSELYYARLRLMELFGGEVPASEN